MAKLVTATRKPHSSLIIGMLQRFGEGFTDDLLLERDQEQTPRSIEQRFQVARDSHRINQAVDLLEKWRLGRLDPLLYRALMRLCARSQSLVEGQRIHQHIAEHGLGENRFLASELVLMYGRCRSVDLARSTFAAIKHPDAWSRNCLLAALTRNGHLYPAIDLFESFPDRNIVSWNTMLQGFVKLGFFQEARDLFLAMHDRDAVSWTIMLTAYTKNRQLDHALSFLAAMPERNVVSWNVVIAAAGREGVDRTAILFRMMLLDGILPVKGTFVTVFESIVRESPIDLDFGRKIHGLVLERNLGTNLLVGNAVLGFYAKCQCVDACERTLQSMEARDTVTWSSMIEAYSCAGDLGKAVEVFEKMVVRDEIAVSSMVVAYARQGYVDRARNLYEELSEKDPQVTGELIRAYGLAGDLVGAETLFDSSQEIDEECWNWMVLAYARSGDIDRSIACLAAMTIEGFQPNEEALLSLLGTCSAIPDGISRGRVLCRELWSDRCFFSSPLVQAETLAMVSAQGSLQEMRSAFSAMTARSIAAWNTLIARHSRERLNDDALKLFYLMNREGFLPDYGTFSSILSGKSAEECGDIFSFMVESFQIDPRLEHYTRLVESVAGQNGGIVKV